MVQKFQKRKSSGVRAFLSTSTKSLIDSEKASPTSNKKQHSGTLSNTTFEFKNILRKKTNKEKERMVCTQSLGSITFDIEINKRRDWPKLSIPKLASRTSKPWKTERLFDAVLDSDFNLTRKLIIVEEMEVNEISPDGNTVLHIASAAGNIDCINMLLECGAKVNSKDSFSRTPLEYAVLYGNFDCATTLIENGADPSVIKDGIS